MIGLCVFFFVVAVVIIYEVLPALWQNYAEAKNNRTKATSSQKSFKKAKAWVIISVIAVVALIIAVLCLIVSESGSGTNTSKSKGKCSWCGKETQLIGSFCSSCNDKAFGEDGWYDKIKD